jgi:hypothetical protein
VGESPSLTPRAKVDAATTTDENRRHWGNADGLGPNAAFHDDVRFKTRNRGRYEYVNNPYCRGMVRSQAYDLIGTCPRPQIQIPGDTIGEQAKAVERSFRRWCDADMFGHKCRVMEKGSCNAGGCFGLLDTNLRQRHPVKLTVRTVEVDQCFTPFGLIDPKVIGGIRIDELGNPIEYHFLKYHPGELYTAGMVLADPTYFIRVPADQVLHWREVDRPGQLHGIPKITSALPLFAQLRRIRLATLTAMEFAAMLAGVLKTNLPPDGAPTTVDNWSLFEMVRGTLLSMPQGWDATQFRSEQPNTTFEMMNRETLNECGRSTGAPLNIVTGNSSGYNFSSGRLDHLPYHRGLTIERDDFRLIVLDPVLTAWEAEARMVGEVPAGLPDVSTWAWTWHFDGFDSIDQNKDATADNIRIGNGTQTYAETYAAYGQDWQEQIDQMAREKEYFESKGLPYPLAAAGNAAPATNPNAPNGLEQMVQIALDEAGIPEQQAAEVIDALGPTFAAMRQPTKRINGHRRNGHPVAGGLK